MSNFKIPDGLPSLSRGSHNPGDGRACVMEYVSLLAGEIWTHLPICTAPALRSGAVYLNDYPTLSDEMRTAALTPMIPRLLGASEDSSRVDRAFRAVAERVYPGLWSETGTTHCSENSPCSDCETVYAVSPAMRAVSIINSIVGLYGYGAGVAYFTMLLDAYDEVTGRGAPAPVEVKAWERAREALLV